MPFLSPFIFHFHLPLAFRRSQMPIYVITDLSRAFYSSKSVFLTPAGVIGNTYGSDY